MFKSMHESIKSISSLAETWIRIAIDSDFQNLSIGFIILCVSVWWTTVVKRSNIYRASRYAQRIGNSPRGIPTDLTIVQFLLCKVSDCFVHVYGSREWAKLTKSMGLTELKCAIVHLTKLTGKCGWNYIWLAKSSGIQFQPHTPFNFLWCTRQNQLNTQV